MALSRALLLCLLMLAPAAARAESPAMVASYFHETGPTGTPGFRGFYVEFFVDGSAMLVACRGAAEDEDCVTRMGRTDSAKLDAIEAAVALAGFDQRPPRALPPPDSYGEARAGWVWGVNAEGVTLPPFVSPADAARMKPVYDAIRAAVPIRDFRRVNRDADRLAEKKKRN